MQIPLISRTHSFSLSSSRSTRGFTLVELLVSIAVIVVITSIVLVKYDSFDSTTLLKNAAYDIALTLRDAQIKSVSAVRNGATDAKYPYGVTFTAGAGVKTYEMFRFESAIGHPESSTTTVSVQHFSPITIDRSMYISDICVNNDTECGLERLDISFRRPEFSALIYAYKGVNTYAAGTQNARIYLKSTKGDGEFYVEVSQLGQISVDN